MKHIKTFESFMDEEIHTCSYCGTEYDLNKTEYCPKCDRWIGDDEDEEDAIYPEHL